MSEAISIRPGQEHREASESVGRHGGPSARLGHRDPSTTLRHYSHATALDDEDVANGLDALLNEA